MESSPIFSIIIPIYGVEKSIERCAISLFEQTLKDRIEFIFVDDASPDRSIEVLNTVLNEYPYRQSQVKILHHEKNKGLPDARYTGWKEAMGDYIANCDSDDWFENSAFEIISDKIKECNSDIVSFDWFMEFPDQTRISSFASGLSKEQVLRSLLNPSSTDVSMSLCGRVIRREILSTNDLRAKSRMTAYEDLVVAFPAYYYSNSHRHLNIPLYHYNQTDMNSMSNTLSTRKIESAICGVNILDSFLASKKDYRFENELRLMKLNAKMPFISNLQIYDAERWKGLWSGLSYQDYPSKWLKVCLYFETNNFSTLNRLYIKAIRNIIKGYRKIFSIRRKT